MVKSMPFFVRSPLWALYFISIITVGIYWGWIASDRYVSQTNVVLESPQIAAPSLSFDSLFGGSGSRAPDMLLLRDFLLSLDMLQKVEKTLDFRAHYADPQIDFFSRLETQQVTLEELHEYYQKMVTVELDDYAQVLRIKVRAFTPEQARDIAVFLLQEGERHMNQMGRRLAEEQVRVLEQQVRELENRFAETRDQLLSYQNEHGLVSPTGTVESLSAVVANLEGELTKLKAQRSTLITYQSTTSPEVVRINAEIRSTEQQINAERARMAQQSGGALNTLSAEYRELELKMQFAQESYSAALGALENTRIEAARKLKQVSVLQSPNLPQYPLEPERMHNAIMFAVVTGFLVMILQMLLLVIKEHQD